LIRTTVSFYGFQRGKDAENFLTQEKKLTTFELYRGKTSILYRIRPR